MAKMFLLPRKKGILNAAMTFAMFLNLEVWQQWYASF